MLPERPPCFVLLGRYGDGIQLLPAFKAIRERTGYKPVVIVSQDYASLYEGVSYVEPFPIRAGWWEGVPIARQIAEARFGGGTVVQWWNDSPDRISLLDAATKGGLVLQSHGHNWGVDIGRWPNYGTSMWDRAGFSAEEMMTLPLVFDRRSATREKELVNRVLGNTRRPVVLYHWSGISSPFGFIAEVLNPLLKMARDVQLVDLGKVQAHRIYDLLAIMERASGMILSDSAPLHLAAAVKTPYLAYTVGGWTRSVPKGNCQLEITYNESPHRVPEMLRLVYSWAKTPVAMEAVAA